MQSDLAALKTWLLTTVPGVILLGALGSIVGSILIMVTRKIAQRLKGRWRRFRISFLYRLFGRDIQIGERFHDHYAAQAESSAYVLFVLSELVEFLTVTGLAIISIAITTVVAIWYGLDRPVLLAAGISISIMLAIKFTRQGVYMSTLTETSAYKVAEQIKEAQPKRYHDWVLMRGKKPPK